jgi:hypothetical protein
VDDNAEEGNAAAEALVAGAGTDAALTGAASPPAEAEGATNALPLASSTTSSSSSSSSSLAVAAAGAATPAAAEAGAAGGKAEAAEVAAPLTALSPAGAIVVIAAAWLSGVSMAGWGWLAAESTERRAGTRQRGRQGAAELAQTSGGGARVEAGGNQLNVSVRLCAVRPCCPEAHRHILLSTQLRRLSPVGNALHARSLSL